MVNSIFTNRRAVRNFSSESISDDEIKSLIAAFQTTPCGMHQTDVMSLVVVKDEALRDKIETKTDNACYHAGWQDWRKTGSNGSFKSLSSYNLLIKKS